MHEKVCYSTFWGQDKYQTDLTRQVVAQVRCPNKLNILKNVMLNLTL